MTNITRIEAIEDNAGGLHMAVFIGGELAHLFSGFEHNGARGASLQEEIDAAVQDGVRAWDGDAEDPAAGYDSLTSTQFGWQEIATWTPEQGVQVDADAMGAAGRAWARIVSEA